MFGLSFNCWEVLYNELSGGGHGVWWALIGYPSMDVCEIQSLSECLDY